MATSESKQKNSVENQQFTTNNKDKWKYQYQLEHLLN